RSIQLSYGRSAIDPLLTSRGVRVPRPDVPENVPAGSRQTSWRRCLSAFYFDLHALCSNGCSESANRARRPCDSAGSACLSLAVASKTLGKPASQRFGQEDRILLSALPAAYPPSL